MNQHNFDELRKLIATSESPHLGPQPRTSTESLDALDPKLRGLLDSLPNSSRDKVRATLLLWHDHLDAAHSIAQNLPGADGSYLHGIMHRREPDYGNAKYWFNSVGKHPAFAEVARRAAGLLKSNGDHALETKLLPRGEWDPWAFIDLCEAAARHRLSDLQIEILRAIQAIELEVLLDHFCEVKSEE